MTALEFGVVLPQLDAGWEDARHFSLRAEDAGFDSVWVADHLLGLPPEKGILEAWTLMSAVAAVTERVGVGAQVLCQSFRNPALLAKMATTLDQVSGGRIPIGVGCVGDRMLDLTARLADEWNFPATGLHRYDQRRQRFDERVAEHGRTVRRSTQIVFAPGERELAPFFEMFRPELGIRGSQAQMEQRVGELVDAGLTGFYGFVPDARALDELAEALPGLRAVTA